MSDTEARLRPAPMQGGGFYNDHAKVQASGGAYGLPLVARAFEDLSLDGRPLVIADYGSAEGRNSLAPVRAAIHEIRSRLGEGVPVSVVHTDQPGNDFSSLFTLLRDSPDSYLRSDPHVFPSAIGRSFFEQIFPADTVSFGWCSFAIHWLSGPPVASAGHIWSRMTRPDIRRQFAERSAADWRLFLGHRASELRAGASLVVVQPSLPDTEPTTFPILMGLAQAELETMLDDGLLRKAEFGRMTVLQYERYTADLRAPFADGAFMGLRLEEDVASELPDSFWPRFTADGNAEKLADSYIGFFQAPFMPSLLAALDGDRDGGFRGVFTNRLKSGLRRRIVSQPAPLLTPLRVHTSLLRKL